MGGRCLVDFEEWQLSLSPRQAKGFTRDQNYRRPSFQIWHLPHRFYICNCAPAMNPGNFPETSSSHLVVHTLRMLVELTADLQIARIRLRCPTKLPPPVRTIRRAIVFQEERQFKLEEHS